MRKVLTSVIALALVAALAGTVAATTVTEAVYEETAIQMFQDIGERPGETHWSTVYIGTAVQAGLVVGFPDGTYKPDKDLTGAEWATMLVRLLGLESTVNPDAALPAGYSSPAWATGYVAKAVELGFLRAGDQAEPVTREDAVFMLVKALALTPDPDAAAFADRDSIHPSHLGYIGAAVSAGIVTGFEDNTFRPERLLSRGEAAALLATALISGR